MTPPISLTTENNTCHGYIKKPTYQHVCKLRSFLQQGRSAHPFFSQSVRKRVFEWARSTAFG